MDRRQFTFSTLVAGGATLFKPDTAKSAGAGTSSLAQIRLGGPVFSKSDDPAELANAHRQLGYRAAYCPGVKIGETERLKAIREAFAKAEVAIAEVGRWVNLLDSDPVKRKANLETVTEGLAIAEAVDARCCVDIAGSFSQTEWFGPHPDNFSQKFFDAAVENARKIIDSVKPQRAKFSYEVMGWALPDGPESYLGLIRAIDRPAFGVHLDPCNAINCPSLFYQNTALLHECYEKLGKWIVSAHAKDLKWLVEMNVHFKEVIPGTGALDYPAWLKLHAALPGEVPLMIEHLASAGEYDQAREFIFSTGKKAGIRF
jgi:sugar phosphate isomerase/epimerase